MTPGGPFQQTADYQRPRPDRRAAFSAQLPRSYVVFDYAASSKFLGYSVLAPPETGVSASKFLGYSVLAPPETGVSASKFLGYVVLDVAPLTLRRFDALWPNPIIPRRLRDYGFVHSANPATIPPAPGPPAAGLIDWRVPPLPRRPVALAPYPVALYGSFGAPIIPPIWPNPLRAGPRVGWIGESYAVSFSPADDLIVSIIWG